MGGKKDNLDPATPGKYQCCCCWNYVFIFLALAAAAILIGFGVAVVAPRIHASEFQVANCTVVDKKYDVGERESCSCGKHCHGDFPCDQIWVNTTVNSTDVHGPNILRYDEKVLHSYEHCSFQPDPCNSDFGKNNYSIAAQMSKFILGDTYKCLYNPEDNSEVIYTRNTEIFHWLFWPAAAFVVCFIITAATCHHCLMAYQISKDLKTARSLGKSEHIPEIIKFHTSHRGGGGGTVQDILNKPVNEKTPGLGELQGYTNTGTNYYSSSQAYTNTNYSNSDYWGGR